MVGPLGEEVGVLEGQIFGKGAGGTGSWRRGVDKQVVGAGARGVKGVEVAKEMISKEGRVAV